MTDDHDPDALMKITRLKLDELLTDLNDGESFLFNGDTFWPKYNHIQAFFLLRDEGFLNKYCIDGYLTDNKSSIVFQVLTIEKIFYFAVGIVELEALLRRLIEETSS